MTRTAILDYLDLGAAAYADGEYDAAEAILRQAAETANASDDNYQGVATVLENLALIYFQKKRYGKTERLLRRALRLHERGSSESYTVPICRITYKLAYLYLTQKRFSFADTLTERAIQVGDNCVARDREMETEMLMRLASLWAANAEPDKALVLYRLGVEIRAELN